MVVMRIFLLASALALHGAEEPKRLPCRMLLAAAEDRQGIWHNTFPSASQAIMSAQQTR